jgi:hypothetical protein
MIPRSPVYPSSLLVPPNPMIRISINSTSNPPKILSYHDPTTTKVEPKITHSAIKKESKNCT